MLLLARRSWRKRVNSPIFNSLVKQKQQQKQKQRHPVGIFTGIALNLYKGRGAVDAPSKMLNTSGISGDCLFPDFRSLRYFNRMFSVALFYFVHFFVE